MGRQKAPLKIKRSQLLKPEHPWKTGDQFRFPNQSDVCTIVLTGVLIQPDFKKGFVFCDGAVNWAVRPDYFEKHGVTRIGNLNG